MKKKYAVLTITTLAFMVYASSVIPYDTSKAPDLSLPAAYDTAMMALGSATNQFHCISATVCKDAIVAPNGGWEFNFYNTNNHVRFVTVEFNGKSHVEDKIRNE